MLILLEFASQSRARADANPPANDPAFSYQQPEEAHPVRAAVEVLTLLMLGLAHYRFNDGVNSLDWQFHYDWASLRIKLDGHAYAFDTNYFETNFFTHPAAGTLYYLAARGNRLSKYESLGYAAAASTLWELFGEFREQASLNDLWVTPMTGFIFGESTFALGAFFDRSCRSSSNAWLGTILAPSKALHDVLDNARLQRDNACDSHGHSLSGSHELQATMGLAGVHPGRSADGPWYAALSLDLRTQVVSLDDYARPGRGTEGFTAGSISELAIRAAFAPVPVDFAFVAGLLPLGLHHRDLSAERYGDEIVFGAWFSMEYAMHRFSDDPADHMDRFFTLEGPGASLRYAHRTPTADWCLDLTVSPTFAGVDAFALPDYLSSGSRMELTSVASAQGYNYAVGISIRPRVRWVTRAYEVGAELDTTRLQGITWRDRMHEDSFRSSVSIAEGRTRTAIWLRLPPVAGVHYRIYGSWLERWGSLGEVGRTRTELNVGTTAALTW